MCYDMLQVFYALTGLLAIFMCLFSSSFRSKLYLTDSMIAMVFGIFLKLGGVQISLEDKTFQLEFARICVGLQVMTTGINMPNRYVQHNWRSFMVMLLPVMLFGWLICTAIILIVPNISFLEASMIAACITPTDPVLANAITTGPFAEKYIPDDIRHLISFESGANDGLGYPFLFLPIYLSQFPTGDAFTQWFLITILFTVLLSIVLGAILGYILNFVCRWTQKESHMSLEYLEIFTVAMSITILGLVGGLGSDDILAVFTCGVIFNRDGFLKSEWGIDFGEGVDTLFNVVFFLYLGSILPVHEWTWQHFIVALLVIVFKRLPVLLLYKIIPDIKNFKQALFVGWFGPIGVSGLFYCLVLLENYNSVVAYPLVTLIIFCSVFVHGLSVPVIVVSDYLEKWSGIHCSLLFDPKNEIELQNAQDYISQKHRAHNESERDLEQS